MNKGKIIVLIFVCVFLSGCSANYEIEIYKDTVKEKININYPLSELDGYSPLEYSEKKSIELFESTDVLLSRQWNQDNENLFSNNKYSFKNYTGELTGIATCYDLYKVNESNNVITVLTSQRFNCFDYYPDLEEVTLKIKSNHKLISTNADNVDKYNYYWYINKDNFEDKVISLKLESKKYIFNYENEFVKKIIYIGAIVGIIVLVGGFAYININSKRNKANQI